MTLPELTEREVSLLRLAVCWLQSGVEGFFLDRPRGRDGHYLVLPEEVDALLEKIPNAPDFTAARKVSREEEEQIVRAAKIKRHPDWYPGETP